MPSNGKIGYLISRYPAVSHTFIQREILLLRKQGITIYTASINEPDIQQEKLLVDDKIESDQTYYIKKQGFTQAFIEVVKGLFKSPRRLLQGVFLSLKLSGLDLKKMGYHLAYIGEALLVSKWMKKHQLNHIHVHFANPAATVALILSYIYPCTYSITIHGPDEFYDVTLNHLAEKFKNAAFLICISSYARSQVMRLLDSVDWKKIEVIPLGVDPHLYRPKPPKEDSYPLEILCVARMTTTKGPEILLQAVCKLLQKQKNIKLTFVGDGVERERLEKKVMAMGLQQTITFKGALNPEQTRQAYKTADIFVLLSFAEGVPVVLMEAMSMEIPCIATGINGIPELIKNDENGLLVAPSDVEGAVEAISRLLEDSSLRLKLGKAGRETILKSFDLHKNIKRLLECFEERMRG